MASFGRPAYEKEGPLEYVLHDIDLERGVCGSLLVWPERIKLVDTLDASHFFFDVPRRVFCAILAVRDSNSPIDSLSVLEEVKRSQKPTDTPLDFKDLHELETYAGRDVTFAAKKIRTFALQRNVQAASYRVLEESGSGNGDFAECFARLSQAVTALEQGDSKPALEVFRPVDGGAAMDEVDYFVFPIAARGLVTVLDGAAKSAGKTTLILTGIKAMLSGELFLNRATRPARTLYVSEENNRTLRMAFARAGLLNENRFLYMPYSSYAGKPWPEVVAGIEHQCKKLEIEWLVVDTFFAVAGLTGELENQAGTVDGALAPLRRLAGKLDLALTVTRHTRKSGGQIGESGRGSSAFTGAADSIIELKRLPGSLYPERRQLEVTGRIESGFMEIELRDGAYILAPEAEVDNSIDKADLLASAISQNRTANVRDLQRITGIDKNIISKLAASRGWQKDGEQWFQIPS